MCHTGCHLIYSRLAFQAQFTPFLRKFNSFIPQRNILHPRGFTRFVIYRFLLGLFIIGTCSLYSFPKVRIGIADNIKNVVMPELVSKGSVFQVLVQSAKIIFQDNGFDIPATHIFHAFYSSCVHPGSRVHKGSNMPEKFTCPGSGIFVRTHTFGCPRKNKHIIEVSVFKSVFSTVLVPHFYAQRMVLLVP